MGPFGRAVAVAETAVFVAAMVKWLFLVKLKSFFKVFGKMAVVVASMYFHVTCGEEAARNHYFWLHLRSTNCKMASP
jgi:hypothetical protein